MGQYTRSVRIEIEVDIWDWSKGKIDKTLSITNNIISYRFQKTIKTPVGSCQLSVTPETAEAHILDVIKPMDVIRIIEFGTVKFIGYIQRVSFSGSIGRDGKPNRQATITAGQFGGLLTTASLGFGLGTAIGKTGERLQNYAIDLADALKEAVADGTSHGEILSLLAENLQSALSGLGADNFVTYLNEYLNISDGLTSTKTPLLPRTFDLYTGTEESLTFWQIAEQLIEKPFNEMWIDNGPRRVFIDGNTVELKSKSYLVFRETPFDNTVGGVSGTSFQDMGDGILIDSDHLTRFDFARSMDEVYTVYSAKPSAFAMSDIARVLDGKWDVDEERLGKYLFKPLFINLYYTRMESNTDKENEVAKGDIDEVAQNDADTLRAWFEKNDEYLTGTISHMVPSDNNKDPKIGDKVRAEGIDGEFYVEGIAHTWRYQGALESTLTVTRGYNRTEPIKLAGKIFKRNRIR